MSEARRVVVAAPPVIVLVPFNQTSAASEPKVVRERVPFAQTAVGIVDAKEVDAVKTVAFVLLLIVVMVDASCEDSCEFVFPLTEATMEDEAEAMLPLIDDVALLICVESAAISAQAIVSVFVLIPVTFDQSIVFVFVLIVSMSAQAIVSVLALTRPVFVTIPVTSAQAIVSVFVLMPVMFPVPISDIRVATLFLTVVTSDQLIVSVFALTAETSEASDEEALSTVASV